MIAEHTPQIGEQILRDETKQVADISAPEVQETITALVDTMRDMGLVGMAAPQINSDLAIFVSEARETEIRKENLDGLRVYINPKIINFGGEVIGMYEGCGSMLKGELFAEVPRHTEVTVNFLDEHGVEHTETETGLLAEIIQHEVDHLHGIMFVDRIVDTKTYKTRENYRKFQEEQK